MAMDGSRKAINFTMAVFFYIKRYVAKRIGILLNCVFSNLIQRGCPFRLEYQVTFFTRFFLYSASQLLSEYRINLPLRKKEKVGGCQCKRVCFSVTFSRK